ncbi:MAG TPA: hypothetical protein VKY33_08860 [Flavobacterium sp.]|nr:hypothetical protein [Flavobacterium sp.]
MFQRYLYSVLLTTTLLFSNLGLAVNIHYCGSVVEKIELGYVSSMSCDEELEEKPCCKEKDESVEKDCCKDETIKQKTDDVTVKVFSSQQFSEFIIPAVYDFQPLVLSEIRLPKKIEAAFHCESNAPPLYKLYQQFLLYA